MQEFIVASLELIVVASSVEGTTTGVRRELLLEEREAVVTSF